MRTIEIGLDQLPRELRRVVPAVKKASKLAAWHTAKAAVAVIKETSAGTNPRPTASGAYERAWKARKTKDSAVVENKTVHALLVEIGRRPGPAPLSPLLKWARYKLAGKSFGNKPPGKKSIAALAFVARRKVMKHGYRGRFVVKRSMKEIKTILAREMKEALKMATRGLAQDAKMGNINPRARVNLR